MGQKSEIVTCPPRKFILKNIYRSSLLNLLNVAVVKSCKGARGLKMHQRCCRVVVDLEQEIQEEMTELLTEQNEDITESDASPVNSQEDFPDLRKGIKLTRSPSQWKTTNEFFKLTFSNYPITAHGLNNNITTMT